MVDKQVWLNGAPLAEPCKVHKTNWLEPYRDNSLDSRYWGFVPRENIIGSPVMVVWSFDAASGSSLRWCRTFKRLIR